MQETVEVNVQDLISLIQALIDVETDSRCKIGAFHRIQDPFVRSKFVSDSEEGKGTAGEAVHLQFRDLIEALNSGEDVRSKLAKFARQLQNALKSSRDWKLMTSEPSRKAYRRKNSSLFFEFKLTAFSGLVVHEEPDEDTLEFLTSLSTRIIPRTAPQ